MVGEPSGGLRTSSFSLTSLLPRQVMLESRSVIAAAGDKLAENKSKKRRKGEPEEKRSSTVARAALLHAIAAFLESGGFTRTLAALRSEAQLEIDNGSKTPVVDLEEIICTYLESSEDPVVGNITGPDEQDAQDRVARKEEGIHDHSEETICKKKKKTAKGGDDNVKTESDKSACKNGVVLPNQLQDKLRGEVPEVNYETSETQVTEESKGQKRKKYKKASKESLESIGNEKSEMSVPLLENVPILLDESNVKSKDKKKKKNKFTTDPSYEVVNQDGLKTSQEENSMGEDNSKSKDKKKRKHNLVVESSGGYNGEVQNRSKVDGRKRGKSVSEVIDEDANVSNPKIENNSSSPNAINLDEKAKKRNRSTSEETELHIDNDAAVQEAKEDLKDGKNKEETGKLDDSLLNSELHTSGKKKKSGKSEDNAERSANTPVNKQSQVQKDAHETPAAINGSVGKNEREENGSPKSKKAELKQSAEPKTVNAFQRVKIDMVKFADERLQDNSYWAKDGAERGYGAKAQEVLGQVRGRDFRHEKTKKKRGSYRGGQIDFQSHSVKFQYSDDEE